MKKYLLQNECISVFTDFWTDSFPGIQFFSFNIFIKNPRNESFINCTYSWSALSTVAVSHNVAQPEPHGAVSFGGNGAGDALHTFIRLLLLLLLHPECTVL
jgi:hypothetical protein